MTDIRKLMGDDFRMRPIDYVIAIAAGVAIGVLTFFALS